MEINDFIKSFAAQFEETDADAFTPGTRFHDLAEWSSFMALSIIAMCDEEYGVKLKGMDIRSAVTIEDLYNSAKSRR